jgi:hypothetical protein
MKDLNTGIFVFEDMIRGNFLYVDKTEYIWQLIRPAMGLYFLSRPRRFGKSLLVSTLKAVFEGKKELFRGLALYDKPYDWQKYPIIHLSMADYGVVSDALQELPDYLMSKVRGIAKKYKIKLTSATPGLCLGELIDRLSARRQVVILVDEYDKPILGNLSDANAAGILQCLKGFYSVLKDRNEAERLIFITGVSKFSHVSLFSDLNNLKDITLNPDYAEMLGFSERDIRENFADRLPAAAKANGMSEEELMQRLLVWYDGYRFSDADTHVCNPVSLTSFFDNGYRFSNYWDSTGTPSFLLKLMGDKAYSPETALTRWYNERIFAAYELDKLDITGLLWQTGYLTIKDVRKDDDELQYRLDFPDREVQETFSQRLIDLYAGSACSDEASDLVQQFKSAIRHDDLEGFLTLFQSFLACISYQIQIHEEKYYQSIFFVVFKLLGASIEAESCTNRGRIDAYVRTKTTVYIFEFKLDKSEDEALDQIVDRRYFEKFQSSGLPIRMVGVNFDSKMGRIDGWKELQA